MAEDIYPKDENGNRIKRSIEVPLEFPFTFGKDRFEVAVVNMPKYPLLKEAQGKTGEQRTEFLFEKTVTFLNVEMPFVPEMYGFMDLLDVARVQSAVVYFLERYADGLEWASKSMTGKSS